MHLKTSTVKVCIRYAASFCILALLLVNCAKRGSPKGGPVDSIPPVFVKATPPNFTTNFEEDEIRIYFDEYIKLKDYQKQLIVSPPLSNTLISPQSGASKYLSIDIKDTLQPNTTYVFNFGQSIVDNNEENPYAYFKYIMSTGDYIDSLTVKGQLVDALERTPDSFVSVVLYEADSSYTDSIVYKESPRYVTNTLDSLTSFEISNIKEGRYKLVAIKDEDGNFTFQPKRDKIGFYESFITVPKDTTYTLKLFSEQVAVNVSRPKHVNEGRINFGVQGSSDSLEINLLSEVKQELETLLTQPKEDTLSFLYKPATAADSLVFALSAPNYKDTVVAKLRNLKKDSLRFKSLTGTFLVLNEAFKIGSNIPLVAIDTSKIDIIADSLSVPFAIENNQRAGELSLQFDTAENTKYEMTLLPEAVTDFFGNVNDTLTYTTKTKEFADYGDIELRLNNANAYPYLVELVNEKGEVKESIYVEEEGPIVFNTLRPSTYYIRLIEDANKNRRYDTGNFLEQRQPERVIYYPEAIELNAGWLPKLLFELKDRLD